MNRYPKRNSSDEACEILLVEDDPEDVRVVEEAMSDVDIDATLHVATDETEALDFLQQRDNYTDAPYPDIVFLDLDLSQGNGIGVLCKLTEKERLLRTPLIILAGSSSKDDVRQAYECGANACLIKPSERDEFVDLLRAFESFWLTAAHLPPTE